MSYFDNLSERIWKQVISQWISHKLFPYPKQTVWQTTSWEMFITLPSWQMAREFLLPATTERTRWEGRALTVQTHSLSSFVPIPNWPSSPDPLQKKTGGFLKCEWMSEKMKKMKRVKEKYHTRQWCENWWNPWEDDENDRKRQRVELKWGWWWRWCLKTTGHTKNPHSPHYLSFSFLIFFLFMK
jgi:hypothetical protein